MACLEPQFFAEFARLLPLEEGLASSQYDRATWDAMRAAITARIKQRSRDEWAALFEATDACVAPVLSFEEARHHPHNLARATHIQQGQLVRPAPAPRLSRTPLRAAGRLEPQSPASILRAFGVSCAEETVAEGIVG